MAGHRRGKTKTHNRALLMSRIEAVDFDAMTSAEYESWINGLPIGEFCELIDLCAEVQTAAQNVRDAELAGAVS